MIRIFDVLSHLLLDWSITVLWLSQFSWSIAVGAQLAERSPQQFKNVLGQGSHDKSSYFLWPNHMLTWPGQRWLSLRLPLKYRQIIPFFSFSLRPIDGNQHVKRLQQHNQDTEHTVRLYIQPNSPDFVMVKFQYIEYTWGWYTIHFLNLFDKKQVTFWVWSVMWSFLFPVYLNKDRCYSSFSSFSGSVNAVVKPPVWSCLYEEYLFMTSIRVLQRVFIFGWLNFKDFLWSIFLDDVPDIYRAGLYLPYRMCAHLLCEFILCTIMYELNVQINGGLSLVYC